DSPFDVQSGVPDKFRDDASAGPLSTENPTPTAAGNTEEEAELPDQLQYVKAPVFRYQYPEDFPDAEQLAIAYRRMLWSCWKPVNTYSMDYSALAKLPQLGRYLGPPPDSLRRCVLALQRRTRNRSCPAPFGQEPCRHQRIDTCFLEPYTP